MAPPSSVIFPSLATTVSRAVRTRPPPLCAAAPLQHFGPRHFEPCQFEPRLVHSTPNRRCYSASTASEQPASAADWPKCAHPTPYDILSHQTSAPYTKTRFRQLVKLYHPDLGAPASLPSSLSRAKRLERYHLIVQAHDVLSDPAKRRAYDACGAHWCGGVAGAAPKTDAERYEAWRKGPYASCARNGTWEDWERWHAEQANPAAKRNEGYYMSNGTFVVLILFTVAIVSIVQTARHDRRRQLLDARSRKQQAELSQSLVRSYNEVEGLGRQERVDRFLRHRENTRYAYQPPSVDVQTPGISNGRER